MTKGKLIRIGSWFMREVKNEDDARTDYYFGPRGEEEHGHVIVISGSPVYEKYMSGAQFTLVSGALTISLD
ncbi:MAG: hypothetical protein ABH873_03060 [Candidatus Firestonebacteria bacterium]